MKNSRSFADLASFALALSVLAAGQATAQTWTGNTDALWDTDANWSGTPPASSGSSALIFNPLNGVANLSTSNDLTGFTATSISFDNSTTTGAYTHAGNQITLGGDITTTGSTGTPTHTISLATILNGNRTITTALNNNLSISGIISGDIAGRSLTKLGSGVLTLSGVNSFSGTATIDKGSLALSGNGSMVNTSGVAIGNRATLTLDNTGTNVGDRTAGAITSSGGTINFLGNAAATTETLGALTLNAGALTINSTPGAGGSTLTIPSITRSVAGGTLYVNGTVLGGGTNQVVLTTAPALTNSVLKYAVVNNGTVTRFATHGGDGTSLAPLATHVAGINTISGANTNLLVSTAVATNSVLNGTGVRQFYTITLEGGFSISSSVSNDRILEIGGGILQTVGSSSIGVAGNANDVMLEFSTNEALFHVLGTLTLNRGNATSATLRGTAGLTKTGTGTLILNGTSSLTTAVAGSAVDINQGTLELRGANALLPNASTVVQNLNGATLRLSNDTNTAYNGNLAVNADSTIQVDRVTAAATATTHTVGALTLGAGRVLSVNSSADITSDTAYGLTTGVLTLAGAATIDVANNGVGTGTMTVAAPSGNFTLTKTGAGDLVTNSTTTGFSGAVDIQAGRIGWSGASGTISQSEIFSSAGGVIKSGAGTVALSGPNTYTGTTTIDAGTLVINGDNGAATGAVSVTGKLTGSGTVGGATTINSAGIHNAGDPTLNNGVGTQTFTSNLTYGSGSIFEWDITASLDADGVDGDDGVAGTNYDNVAGVGTKLADSGSIFKVVLGGAALTEIQDTSNAFWNTPFQTQVWNMANIFSSFSGSFTEVQTSLPVSSYGAFTINGTNLTWTAVPEPTSALAGLLITAGLLRRRRLS